jgi:hypothetical protein
MVLLPPARAMVVELLEQHEQQQRDHHPDGGFGKHIIHENSSDADRTNTNFCRFYSRFYSQ